jgi:tetratricopeptide (TPR) repeat protein
MTSSQSHRTIEGIGNCGMGRGISGSWVLAAALAALIASPSLRAQATDQKQQGQSQNQPSSQTDQNGSQKPATQDNGNPFPEDEGNVPVMPSSNSPDVTSGETGVAHATAPAVDSDPVRSPDSVDPGASDSVSGFSSSTSGTDLAPSPDDDTQGKKKKQGDEVIQTFPKETAEQDMNVGSYYLDIKDWRGALSRFQSAMVLAPDNPDVYWGLAESERHLGQFAAARENYTKVMEYDPGSHHAKEAKKALQDPQVANAKAGEKQ